MVLECFFRYKRGINVHQIFYEKNTTQGNYYTLETSSEISFIILLWFLVNKGSTFAGSLVFVSDPLVSKLIAQKKHLNILL